MRVLDSSAIINNRGREIERGAIVPPGVIEEVRDIESRVRVEEAIEEGTIRVVEPSEGSVKRVRREAAKVGSGSMLSDTDLTVVALGYERRAVVVSDDYDIQNLCRIMGIRFEGVVMPEIKRSIKWERECMACGKRYGRDVEECEVCGSREFRYVIKRGDGEGG